MQPILHSVSKKVCLFNKKVFKMKKVFSFLMIALVVMSVVSCKKKATNEPDDPSNPSEQTDPSNPSGQTDPGQGQAALTITMSNITGSSAAMSVVPGNQNQTYYFSIIESSYVQGLTDAQLIQQVLIAEMDYIIEYYSGQYDVTYADLLSTGNDGYEFTKLAANTEYLALAAYIGTDGKATDGKLAKQSFKTSNSSSGGDSQGGGGSQGGGSSSMTFSIQQTSASITVVPSNSSELWDYYFMEKSEFTSSWGSDADALAAAAFDAYGASYATQDTETFLFTEMIQYGMTAGSWVLIVWGCDNYGVTTKAQAVTFTLTGSSSGGSYGDDYSDYFGGGYYAPARHRMPLRKTMFHTRFVK